MIRRALLLGLAGALLVAAAACTDDGPERDLAGFCAAVEDLAENDPFTDLQVASPEEMRTAFDQLREGVDAIAARAPDDLRARTEEYRDTVDVLIDQLRGAGFDPRNLDTLAYRSAADDYEAAAVSVENAAASACG